MKSVIIIIALTVIIKSQTITASLNLIQYQPYVFQLDFSEPVQKPTFQLLRNHLNEINYTLLTTQLISKTFFIEAQPPALSSGEYLQNYEIIFNSPLKIGSGRLGVSYFMIKSSKGPIITQAIQALGIAAVVLGYILIIFTDIGQKMIEFMRIYCLIMFIGGNKSTLYLSMSKGLLLIDPHAITSQKFQSQYLLYYMVPILIVTVTGLIGFILKRCIRQKKSIIDKILYEKFVYDIFVIVSVLMITPIFFNSLSYFHIIMQHQIKVEPGVNIFCSLSSLYGIILVPIIIYLFAYQINPKVKETQQSWNKYIKSQNFSNFRKLHEHVHLKSWYKRNQLIFIVSIRVFRLMFFFIESIFVQMVFFLEFFELLYIFTIRPFKNQLYINIMVILRLSKIAFFGIVIIGNLYFSLGDITLTYASVTKYILARVIIFFMIVLEFLIFIAYELIVKCSNFNYHVRLIRQENEFKLKITQKDHQSNENESRGHKQTMDSSDNSYTRGRVQSTTTNAQSVNVKLNSSQINAQSRFSGHKSTITSSVTVQKQLKQYLKGSSTPKRSRTKGQIEMVDLTKSKLMKDVQQRLSPTSSKKKWKKQSLLAKISKDK